MTSATLPKFRIIPLEGAELPERAHDTDAGLDLYAYTPDRPIVLAPGESMAVSAGFYIEVPEDYTGLVVPRSGRSLKRPFLIPNSPGVLDPGYQGELKVIQRNAGAGAFAISHGEKFAQLLFVHTPRLDYKVVGSFEEATQRGTKGFGSTGSRATSNPGGSY